MCAKKVKRVRHVPQRTCVGCRLVLPKRTLIRIVRTPEGVVVDQTGKMAGRGAYLHNQRSCWVRALKGTLAHALKTDLTSEDQERLLAHVAMMPEDVTVEQTEEASGMAASDLNQEKTPAASVEDEMKA